MITPTDYKKIQTRLFTCWKFVLLQHHSLLQSLAILYNRQKKFSRQIQSLISIKSDKHTQHNGTVAVAFF